MSLPNLTPADQVRPSVWAADDDEDFLELFRVACGSMDLSEVFFANSGHSLTQMLERFLHRSSYAVVFVDIRMEEEDAGFRVVERIRGHQSLSLCPVVVMSSSLLQEDITKALKLGANSCFYKPTGTKKRVEAVQRHLDYWTSVATLPKIPKGHSSLGDPPTVLKERGRGTPWYAVDRLRQDILVALLRDLERQSAIDLAENTKHILRKSLTRLEEVFIFRRIGFDETTVDSVRAMTRAISEWVDAGEYLKDDVGELLFARTDSMKQAKSARAKLSIALRKMAKLDDTRYDFEQLDFLIWDIFIELSHDPNFQHLYASMTRFQRKAFR